jgi:hypothetical protein
MGLYLLKLLLWCPTAIAQTLPCLTSSNECVNELTEKAIASSNKLKKLDEKIALIDERLELMGDRIAYSQKKTWTNYVTLDPVKLLQNLFGGGDVQRDRIAVSPSASAAAPQIWKLRQPIY